MRPRAALGPKTLPGLVPDRKRTGPRPGSVGPVARPCWFAMLFVSAFVCSRPGASSPPVAVRPCGSGPAGACAAGPPSVRPQAESLRPPALGLSAVACPSGRPGGNAAHGAPPGAAGMRWLRFCARCGPGLLPVPAAIALPDSAPVSCRALPRLRQCHGCAPPRRPVGESGRPVGVGGVWFLPFGRVTRPGMRVPGIHSFLYS